MPIDQSLINEIDLKQTLLVKRPEYYLARSRKIGQSLIGSARLYSWWMENPTTRYQVLAPKNNEERRKAIAQAKEGIANLSDAWTYIRNVATPLDGGVLLETARLVEPKINSQGFRSSGFTFLKRMRYVPPNPLKVSSMLEKALQDLKNGDLHPVEQAALTHLYLTGIQPFNEGNKRVARLAQNKLLLDVGLPVAVIPVGERAVYYDLLEQGLLAWQSGNLKDQRPFLDYVGGKVNSALDEILGDLNIDVKGLKIGKKKKC